MIQSVIIGMVLIKVKKELIDEIISQIKPLEKYVHEENDADKLIQDLERRIAAVEKVLTSNNS